MPAGSGVIVVKTAVFGILLALRRSDPMYQETFVDDETRRTVNTARSKVEGKEGTFVQRREETPLLVSRASSSLATRGIKSYQQVYMAMTTPRSPCIQFVGPGNDVTPPSSVPIFTNVSPLVCGSHGLVTSSVLCVRLTDGLV